ncbi:hypothetical protein LTR70_006131 [Exophiala xenobiotica]|uniref:Uncharacterized protein n=1 Tax=Lithohypha guttulata TaxID=1690604 RepID=A0ABR0K8C3_9EURO|nr:hypothetical protein LTR24_005632 [Lithohypha guttulata]KAK5316884.1 hypothetical protein LTR70_006131 [Exophiala xenobiotica]
MMQLWLQCQRDFDLSPFELRIESSSSSAFQSASSSSTQLAQRRESEESQLSPGTTSISPTQVLRAKESSEEDEEDTGKQCTKSRASTKSSDSKPGITRTPSVETSRKRSNVAAGAARGRVRPPMIRKRSSQAGPSAQPVLTSENVKPRKSIIKSPRTSTEEQSLINERHEIGTAVMTQMTATPKRTVELPGRKISTFELSASSWQSVESQTEPSTGVAVPPTSPLKSPLVIDNNFRERFQHQLRSSTNLAGMKAMRKTGSVVRFADEVDVPEDFRKLRGAARQKDVATPHSSFGESSRRTESEGQQSRSDTLTLGRPARPTGNERHDSTGSVAAISDDGSDDFDAEDVAAPIPRTRSQLSMAIADLRRSQSLSEREPETSFAVASPDAEEEQQALISGKQGKILIAEEEKLLAMGRKDGVTKAGGVNLPKELTVKGRFLRPDDGYESPEEPIY